MFKLIKKLSRKIARQRISNVNMNKHILFAIVGATPIGNRLNLTEEQKNKVFLQRVNGKGCWITDIEEINNKFIKAILTLPTFGKARWEAIKINKN